MNSSHQQEARRGEGRVFLRGLARVLADHGRKKDVQQLASLRKLVRRHHHVHGGLAPAQVREREVAGVGGVRQHRIEELGERFLQRADDRCERLVGLADQARQARACVPPDEWLRHQVTQVWLQFATVTGAQAEQPLETWKPRGSVGVGPAVMRYTDLVQGADIRVPALVHVRGEAEERVACLLDPERILVGILGVEGCADRLDLAGPQFRLRRYALQRIEAVAAPVFSIGRPHENPLTLACAPAARGRIQFALDVQRDGRALISQQDGNRDARGLARTRGRGEDHVPRAAEAQQVAAEPPDDDSVRVVLKQVRARHVAAPGEACIAMQCAPARLEEGIQRCQPKQRGKPEACGSRDPDPSRVGCDLWQPQRVDVLPVGRESQWHLVLETEQQQERQPTREKRAGDGGRPQQTQRQRRLALGHDSPRILRCHPDDAPDCSVAGSVLSRTHVAVRVMRHGAAAGAFAMPRVARTVSTSAASTNTAAST